VSARTNVQRLFIEDTRLGIPRFHERGHTGVAAFGATAMSHTAGYRPHLDKPRLRARDRRITGWRRASGYTNIFFICTNFLTWPATSVGVGDGVYGEDPYCFASQASKRTKGAGEFSGSPRQRNTCESKQQQGPERDKRGTDPQPPRRGSRGYFPPAVSMRTIKEAGCGE